jgi:hypothetical protein
MAQELIGAPLTLFLAPVGTPFPDFDDPEVSFDAGWVKVGLSGDKNYTDDGVTVDLAQTIETFTPAGGTLPRKAWRTMESVDITVNVADMRAEALSDALNGNDVTTGVDFRSIPLLKGIDVTEYALLARGLSAYDGGASQIQVPRCYQSAEPSITFNKGEAASAELTFAALDPEGNQANFVWIVSDNGS